MHKYQNSTVGTQSQINLNKICKGESSYKLELIQHVKRCLQYKSKVKKSQIHAKGD